MVELSQWTQVGLIVDAVGGGLYLLLGLAVLMLRPRTRASVGFALFTSGLGLAFLFANLWVRDPASTVFLQVALPGIPIAYLGAVVLVSSLPGLSRQQLVATLVLAGVFALLQSSDVWAGTQTADWSWPQWTLLVGACIVNAGYWSITIGAGLAYGRARSPAAQRRILVIGLALLPWAAWSAGMAVWYAAVHEDLLIDTGGRMYATAWAFMGFVQALIWMRAGWNLPGDRTPGRIGLGFLAVMAVSAVVSALLNSPDFSDVGIGGLLRTIGVFTIAYAIVSLHLFDLDVRLKWTISKGTLASIFIATFFVITVVAENFLTDRYGWAIGGIGAGLLLFAINPLQRVGQRIADRAMPNVKSIKDRAPAERLALFRGLCEDAWADGSMSRKERMLLDNAARRLGLDAEAAVRIEREAAGA